VKVLVFTTVFPNAIQRVHGLFVAERTRRASQLAEICVVAPVAWFRGSAAAAGEPPMSRVRAVEHPRWYYAPGVFKSLDGLFLFLSALPASRRLKRDFGFDLIDAHFGYPDGVAAILLGYWFRRPVTITLRGSEVDMVKYRMRRAILGWALRRADRVIAVSSQLAELARHLGVPGDSIRVIGNGVDLERFRPLDRASARQRLKVSESAKLVVSVGHLARVKGFHRVLPALSDLAQEHSSIQFVIVGGAAGSSGTYPAELAQSIARLGLEDRVTITGAVPPDTVADWLSAADVFVLASEREGSPNALREAMACGCPVVAADVGDAAQIVTSRSGRLVRESGSMQAWRDAVSQALFAAWDRAAIRADAERHSWQEAAARVHTEWEVCARGAMNGVRARATAR
jgi:teichuronic acid biosynthesis glycosyltransferase TuaC